ncbi:MAG: aldehyde dehydrogenase family protein [Kiritimatiellae bacterium]|nr:aldehyde dehydrogenase family protein [Kiritimatiellia bacterium]
MKLTPVNPRTEELLEPVDCTTREEVHEKVARARAVQGAWQATPFEQRAEHCRRAAEQIEADADQIAGRMHAETGKPVQQARGETVGAARALGSAVTDMQAALAPEERAFKDGLCRTHYLPHGVAAVIGPWNFPAYMPLEAIWPCLLAGNTVLFKPSEFSPYTGIAMADALAKHLPADVFHLVLGTGEEGGWLTAAEIDFIAFVGSRATGKAIMKQASDRLCRLLLELGGKDAMLVAHDADLEQAAQFAVRSSLQNAGQVCVAVERVYVERAAEAPFIAHVVELAADVALDAGRNGQMVIGPMSNAKQMRIVLDHIRDALEKGAKLELGGKRLDRAGYWVEPTVMSGLTPDMKLMREETFGPVVAIRTVDSLEDAIREANDTRYGLTATIWGGQRDALYAQALRLEAGLVAVNGRQGGAPGVPRAPAKESGFGFMGGVAGMRQFLQPRTVTIRT